MQKLYSSPSFPLMFYIGWFGSNAKIPLNINKASNLKEKAVAKPKNTSESGGTAWA